MYTLFPIALCIFILTVISAVSINAIYTKRQLRNYAIFYICGATKGYCNTVYILEIAMHILLCFGVAYLLFDGIILQPAIKAYSGIELAYNKSNYMFILLSYIIISVVIAFVCVLPSAVSGQIAKRQQ